MSEHIAIMAWKRSGAEADFFRGKYSRDHTWTFDGGAAVQASASAVVPPPWSNPALVDPEEALVAAVASCHLLSFLYVAAKAGFQADSYEDRAAGRMSKNEKGVFWVSAITLRPKVVFGGAKQPTKEELEHLHHQAHEACFIANSVKSEITVEPQ